MGITPHLKAGHGKRQRGHAANLLLLGSDDGEIIIGHIGAHLLNDTGLNTKFC